MFFGEPLSVLLFQKSVLIKEVHILQLIFLPMPELQRNLQNSTEHCVSMLATLSKWLMFSRTTLKNTMKFRIRLYILKENMTVEDDRILRVSSRLAEYSFPPPPPPPPPHCAISYAETMLFARNYEKGGQFPRR